MTRASRAARALSLAALAICGAASAPRVARPPAVVVSAGDAEARVEPDGEIAISLAPRAPPLLIRTTSITRGDRRLDAPAGAPSSDGRRAATFSRGLARERIEVAPHGVEHTLEFAAAPPGDGPLTVRVATSEPAIAAGAVADFPALRVQCGDVAWVDARGERTPLAPAVEGGEVVLRVPAEVLDRAAYPAVLDPTFSPEIDLHDPQETPWTADFVSAAFDGTNFVVAWSDSASALAADSVLAVHVSPTTGPIETTPIVVSSGAGAVAPAVASDGTNALVVWSQPGMSSYDIFGAYVSPTGVVTPLPSPLDASASADAEGPSLTWTGDRFAVIWARGGFTNVATLAGTTVVPSAETPPIATGFAGGGSSFVIAWEDALDGESVEAIRYGDLGIRLDANPVVAATSAGNVSAAMAPDGDVLLAWVSSADGTAYAAIWPAGSSTTPGPAIPLPGTASTVHAAFDGTRYWVAQTSSTNAGLSTALTVTPIETNGVLGATLTETWSGAPSTSSLACGGGSCLFAVRREGALEMVRFAPSQLLDPAPVPVGSSLASETPTSVAWASSTFIAPYLSEPTGVLAVSEVDSTGAVIDGKALTTHSEHAVGGRAAFDGRDAEVLADTFPDGATMLTKLFDVQASPLRAPFDETGSLKGGDSDVACGTSGACLAVDNNELGGQGVSALLHLHAAGFGSLLTIGTDGHSPRVAATPGAAGRSYFLVAWQYLQPDGRTGVEAVVSAGTSIDFPVDLGIATNDPMPAVTFDGANFVIAWADDRLVYATRVDPAGNLVGSHTLLGMATSALGSIALAPVGDGLTTLVVWREVEPTPILRYNLFEDGDARLTDGGSPAPATLASPTGPPMAPTAGAGSPGHALVAYGVAGVDRGHESNRARAQLVTFEPFPGAACTSDAGCSTQRCVEGVCCDKACDDPCQECSTGACEQVVDAPNPGRCDGDSACSAAGQCGLVLGQACSAQSECESGHCADDVCCATRCSGPCDSCDASGTCVTAPSCSVSTCDGDHMVTNQSGPPTDCGKIKCSTATGTCLPRCESSLDCVSPYLCGSDSQCEDRPPQGVFSACAAAPPGDGAGAGALGLAAAAIAFGLRRRRSARRRGPAA
jgi:MYXO-CTERM domain-containing protein